MFYLVLSCPILVLWCAVLFFLVLSCLVLPYLALPCLALSCPVLSCSVLPLEFVFDVQLVAQNLKLFVLFIRVD